MNLLFVYGTLKRGFHRNQLLGISPYLGTATTRRTYCLLNIGAYPAIIETDVYHPNHVYGELYEVSDQKIHDLDIVEGVGSGLYDRKEVMLHDITLQNLPFKEETLKAIQNKVAICYFWGANQDHPIIESGLWEIKSPN